VGARRVGQRGGGGAFQTGRLVVFALFANILVIVLL
jgi:hypothetical protein